MFHKNSSVPNIKLIPHHHEMYRAAYKVCRCMQTNSKTWIKRDSVTVLQVCLNKVHLFN